MGSGGVGLVMHMSSMHWLRVFMISWSLFCAFTHWVCVSVSCSRVVVRLSIARFCVSKNVVWSFWMVVSGIGYVIRGVIGWVVVSLRTILFGASCS